MPGGHHGFPGIISFYIQLVTPSVVVTAVGTARAYHLPLRFVPVLWS